MVWLIGAVAVPNGVRITARLKALVLLPEAESNIPTSPQPEAAGVI